MRVAPQPGNLLFRRRGLIGTASFLLLLPFARPIATSLVFGLGPTLAGIALRVWAAGHLGLAGRASEV
ncbi:MAG: hypothetical protein ABIK62_02955, partial [candidate division WOR-3 bacterium]